MRETENGQPGAGCTRLNAAERGSRMRNIRRGEVYYIEKRGMYGMTAGQPAVTVSDGIIDGCVIIAYMTAEPREETATHVKIRLPVRNPAMAQSTALCEKISTVPAERISSYICSLTEEETAALNSALMTAVGLRSAAAECRQAVCAAAVQEQTPPSGTQDEFFDI